MAGSERCQPFSFSAVLSRSANPGSVLNRQTTKDTKSHEGNKTLRIAPAMAGGLSDHVWTFEEIVLMADLHARHKKSAA